MVAHSEDQKTDTTAVTDEVKRPGTWLIWGTRSLTAAAGCEAMAAYVEQGGLKTWLMAESNRGSTVARGKQ